MAAGPCLLGVVLVGLSACGIESYAYMTAPSIGGYFSSLTPEAKFYHYGANVEDASIFRGYQLYYKFYSIDTTPVSSLDEYSELSTYGFTRVYTSEDSDSSSPSMSSIYNVLVEPEVADREKNFTVYISFWNLTGDDEPSLTISSTDSSFTSSKTIELRRYVTYSDSALYTGYCKSFHDIVSGDADISTSIYASYISKGTVYIAFYAVAYGIQDLTTAVYSDPVWLGYLQWD